MIKFQFHFFNNFSLVKAKDFMSFNHPVTKLIFQFIISKFELQTHIQRNSKSKIKFHNSYK